MSTIATTIDNLSYFIDPPYSNSSLSIKKIETDIARNSRKEERTAFNTNIIIIEDESKQSPEEDTYFLPEDNEIERAIINNYLKIISNKLDIIESIGDNWDNDGTKGPNSFSIQFSRELAFQVIENNFMPLTISQSVEEGICFVFKDGNKYLYIEIYNDEEIGLIIEDYKNKKILKNISIKSKQDIINEINKFYHL